MFRKFGALLITIQISLASRQRPHIVVLMADDLGWNDVSHHDRARQIPTPNIDALGFNGIVLNRHYSQPMCTPSRAAFMTGQYPIRTGTQHSVIDVDQPWGLPLNQKLVPEYFQEAGYGTYLVGKWHLGMWKRAYTPLRRGFDHHFGYWGPYIDYWTKTMVKLDRKYARGRDFRHDYDVVWDNSSYVTSMLTDAAVKYIQEHPKNRPMFLMVNHLAPHTGNEDDPMQAPPEEISKFSHIKDDKRRVYAAMVSIMDQGVGKVVEALKQAGMLGNCVVVFISDNGAPVRGIHANHGSNYPFRGQKDSPWEGGVRVPAVLWSSSITKRRRVSNELFHITDWLPTLLQAAGLKTQKDTDGVDQWGSLAFDLPSPRKEVLVNVDPVAGWGAIIKDGWKLVNGTFDSRYASWLTTGNEPRHLAPDEYISLVLESDVHRALGSLRRDEIARLTEESGVFCGKPPDASDVAYKCEPSELCLFHLDEDKCEHFNIASLYPKKVAELWASLERHAKTAERPGNRPTDPNCNPAYYNSTWTFWGDLPRSHAAISDVSNFGQPSIYLR